MCRPRLGTSKEEEKKIEKSMTSNMPLAIFHSYFLFKFISATLNAQFFSSIPSLSFYLFHLFVLTLPVVYNFFFFGQCIIFEWNVNEMKITWFNRHFIRNYFVCVCVIVWIERGCQVEGVQCENIDIYKRKKTHTCPQKKKGCYSTNHSCFQHKNI